MRNWLTFFTRGPKRVIRRLGAGLAVAGRGFLSGWRGEKLEVVVEEKLRGLPPITREEKVRELLREGEIEVPAGKVAITPDDILRTAVAKLPKDIIIQDIPWEKRIIDKPAPWAERFHYKVHYAYLEEYVDDEGVVRLVELDDWITVIGKEAVDRGEVIVRGLAMVQMATIEDETPYAGKGIVGVLEVHEIEYAQAMPTVITEFLKGFSGD